MRHHLRTGASALLLLSMFAGSLVLWVGVPLAWLYVGSHIQGATNSVGAAMAAMFVGAVMSIALIASILARLNRKHVELREARGLDSYGQTALEAVLVVSAGCALVVFVVWFFGFSGAEPFPLELGG